MHVQRPERRERRGSQRDALISRAPAADENSESTAQLYGTDGAAWCRPHCALACPVTWWSHLLDDDPLHPPIRWRLAWVLYGMPDPLARDEWRAALAAVADVYGTEAVVAGLRLADTIPTNGQQPWRRGELTVIAEAIERRAREAA